MLRFELRHYMYLPLYLSHALCHPSTGVPVCLSVSPGFRRSVSLTQALHAELYQLLILRICKNAIYHFAASLFCLYGVGE